MQALLQMRHTENALINSSAQQVLVTMMALILRQCIDASQPLLQAAYEQMLRATCNGQPISLQELTSRRHALRTKRYQKDWKVFASFFDETPMPFSLARHAFFGTVGDPLACCLH